MHKPRIPTVSAASLGPDIAAARAAGVKWKDLEARYGLSRAWLDRVWGEFKGRRRCACPRCGHVFDPKKQPASPSQVQRIDSHGGEEMTRRGRKRKAGQRHKCGKLRRPAGEPVDRGTQEMQALRANTTGDQALSPD